MQMKKKLPMREKTLYSILWGCTLVAAATVILLTIFTVAKRGQKPSVQPDSTRRPTVTTVAGPRTEPEGTEPNRPTTAPDTAEQIDAPVLRFVMPCVGELSKKHNIETLSYSLTMNDYRTHRGVDISGEIGDAVYSCADGMVTGVYSDPLMGKCVEVTHLGGYKSIYRNLADELPEGIMEGCTVSAGQVIAAIGESARVELAEEPHLHFEVLLDGKPIDPASVLNSGK